MASLLDLIDLKDTKNCKVKINNQNVNLVHLHIVNKECFAIIEGGRKIKVTQDVFEELSNKLETHLKTHILKK